MQKSILRSTNSFGTQYRPALTGGFNVDRAKLDLIAVVGATTLTPLLGTHSVGMVTADELHHENGLRPYDMSNQSKSTDAE